MNIKIPRNAAKVFSYIGKHSSTILAILGGIGTVGAVIASAKATVPAVKALDAYDAELVRSGEKDDYGWQDLPLKTKAKVAWKYYLPTALLTGASIGCVAGSHRISYKQTAALTTAYAVTESALKDYMAKTLEVAGPAKVDEIEAKIAKDRIDSNQAILPPNYAVPSGNGTLFFDAIFGRYFFSTIQKVDSGLNQANALMNDDGYISVNDLFDYVAPELDHVKLGDDLGFNRKNGLLKRFRRKAVALSEASPFYPNYPTAIVLEYDVQPKADFDNY